MIIMEMQQKPTIISANRSIYSLNHPAIVNKILQILPKFTCFLNRLDLAELYLRNVELYSKFHKMQI